ncbi:MAG: hypothetical protein H8D45_30115 [Bacteroidetes bacterium]|nr:hypothetical protein [Bacteroidota bacterium]
MKSKQNQNSRSFIRNLIAKEIELGFLYIDSKARTVFPKESGEIRVKLGNSTKVQNLIYNAKHNRIFGLVSWYRRNNLIGKSQIAISVDDDGIIHLQTLETPIEEPKYTPDEIEEIVDLSGLSSMAKGDIVEDRIKEIILLYGQGSLSVYKPVSDSEGIDLIVVKNGVFQPLFLQVKGRFKLQNDRTFISDVRLKTFNPHHSYFVVGAYFNPNLFEIDDHILFIPSKTVKKLGTVINARGEERYRITTNILKPEKSKWAEYVITKQGLVEAILNKFDEMEKYLK